MADVTQAELEEVKARFRETLGKAQASSFMLVLGAAICSPREADKETVNRKLDAAMDAFQQAFKLLRDLADGK